jgi:uncharacterized membrane protein
MHEWDKDVDLRVCHAPNCEQHGKSPCEGVGCDGMDDEERRGSGQACAMTTSRDYDAEYYAARLQACPSLDGQTVLAGGAFIVEHTVREF